MTNQTFAYQQFDRADVAVVGGGLLGKTAALACAQAGLKVALLATPAAPDAGLDSRDLCILFQYPGVAGALARLAGADPRTDDAGLRHACIRRCDGAIAFFRLSGRGAATGLDCRIRSGRTRARQRAAFSAASHLVCAARTGLGGDEETAVLTLEQGPTIAARLVLGADGVHPWVRAQIGSQVKRRDYRQLGVVANFRAELPHGETAFQWFRDGEILALLPLPQQHVSLVWSAHQAHAQDLLALDPAQLAHTVEAACGRRLGALECVTPARGFPLALQNVDRLAAPRVALIGDAAHAMHPLAGQGMNLGMRDVATLADVLAQRETFRDLGDLTLLRRYERARRADIEKLLAATDGLHRLFAAPGTVARGLRNLGMSLVSAQPWVKRWLIAGALG